MKTAHAVAAVMKELSRSFQKGWNLQVHDPTQFIEQSVEAVIHTLFEAVLLV